MEGEGEQEHDLRDRGRPKQKFASHGTLGPIIGSALGYAPV